MSSSSGYKQVFLVLVTLEILTPVLSFVIILWLRVHFLLTRSTPAFNRELNQKFLQVEEFKSESDEMEATNGFIYVCIFFAYFLGKFIMAVKFWQNSMIGDNRTRNSNSIKWILITGVLSIVGILFIFPLKSYRVIEVGFCICLLITSIIISAFTVLYLSMLYSYTLKKFECRNRYGDSPVMTTKF